MPKLAERLRAAVREAVTAFRFTGLGGAYGGQASGTGSRTPAYFVLLPGSRQDWQRKAGDLWLNSAVGIFLNWIQLSFPEAIPCVARLKPDGTYEYLHDHPLSRRLRRPSPNHSARAFWSGTINSYLCDGNGYWIKLRRRGVDLTAGDPSNIAGYQYVPHYQMEPRWPEDGSQFISHYERFVDGQWIPIGREDVAHFPYGVDPRNERKGLSPWKAQHRQVATDNENSTYTVTLAENNGLPGLMISPKDANAVVDADDMERFAKRLAAKTTGDRRFTPEVSPVGVNVERMTLSPEEMALDKLLWQPAWRIGAAVLIDSLVVGLPSENRGSYDNREQAEKAAWNNAILPWMAMLADDMTRQLLPDYEDVEAHPELCVAFDTKMVRALRVNVETLLPVLVPAAGGPVLTPNEARGLIGYEDSDGGDEMREPIAPDPAAAGNNNNTKNSGNGKGKTSGNASSK